MHMAFFTGVNVMQKDPGSRWRARSNENTLLKASAEWSYRRAVC